jgi:acyl dehydratase
MKTADRKRVERNLDLIFEFEKYVLEHPEITEKIPRDAVVFMKVAGDQKFNHWSERQAKKQAKPGVPLVSITVKKMGPVRSRIEGLALEYAA